MNSCVRRGVFATLRGIDRSLLMGIAVSLALLILAIMAGGAAVDFVHVPSLILVLGGTIGATLVHFSGKDLEHAWHALGDVIRAHDFDPASRIRYLMRLAYLSRMRGTLVLEREAQRTDDAFLKTALELAADNQPPDDVRRILETEKRTAAKRAARAVQVFETMGSYAPALGLIGTLIGLIQMLSALDNPATVGPAMSMALITTLYGALFANLLCLPLAGKLANLSEEEALIKSLTIEATISLCKQENPIILEQRLQSFLPAQAG